MKTTDCPFCDETQRYRTIVESAHMRAIYPKAPACQYHVLLMPKRHCAHFDELKNEEVAELHDLLQKLVAVAKENIPDFIGYNLLSNNGGPAVRQRVMHCHMHVFLRSKSDIDDPVMGKHSGTPPELSESDMKNLADLRKWLSS